MELSARYKRNLHSKPLDLHQVNAALQLYPQN